MTKNILIFSLLFNFSVSYCFKLTNKTDKELYPSIWECGGSGGIYYGCGFLLEPECSRCYKAFSITKFVKILEGKVTHGVPDHWLFIFDLNKYSLELLNSDELEFVIVFDDGKLTLSGSEKALKNTNLQKEKSDDLQSDLKVAQEEEKPKTMSKLARVKEFYKNMKEELRNW